MASIRMAVKYGNKAVENHLAPDVLAAYRFWIISLYLLSMMHLLIKLQKMKPTPLYRFKGMNHSN